MKELKVRIYSNGSAEIELDGTIIENESELDEIVNKIHNKEVNSQVFYEEKLTTLYSMQGGIGAKGVGYIAPLLFNPLANLFIALCE